MGKEYKESVLDKLAKTNRGLEMWWDSSPLVYETWRKQMLAAAPDDQKEELAAQLLRLWDPEHPEKTLWRGVTTNPPLSLAAIKDNPERWAKWVDDYSAAHPQAGVEEVFWAMYKEVVRLGAEAFRPSFEASGYRFGHISGQVDPRSAFDADAMLRQALEIHEMGPNVMIKIPGTKEGVKVIGQLTARGIATNCTLAFTVPQFIAVAESVQAGVLEARKNNVDLTRWRSVVTQMSARWESSLKTVAKEAGLEVSPNDARWAGIAIFKEAYRIYRERAYPSKMLICSLRVGPEVNGEMRLWHLEHTAGADAVFTLPPNFLTEMFQKTPHVDYEDRVFEPVPSDVMARLRKIPFFNEGYDADGYSIDQFNTIHPLVNTYNEFSGATEKTIDFVRQRMAAKA